MNNLLISILRRYRKVSQIPKVRITAIITIAVASLFMSLPWAIGFIAKISYNRSNYDLSKNIWQINKFITWHDRDINYANKASALYKTGDLNSSINEYDKAIELAPLSRACEIRWNLGLSLKKLGENVLADSPTDTIRHYSKAISTLSFPDCLNDEKYHKKFQDLIDELTKKANDISKIQRDKNKKPSKDQQNQEDLSNADDKQKQEKIQKVKIQFQDDQARQKQQNQTQADKDKSYDTRVW